MLDTIDMHLSLVTTKATMTSKKHSSSKAPDSPPGQDKAPSRDSRSGKGSEYMAGRRSLAYELRESGGLSSGRLGLEILFLLPDEFITFYTDLFHRALSDGVGNQGKGSSKSATGSGEDQDLRIAKGRTGTVLGSDNRLQAQGSGKKYRNTTLVIKDERALKVKGSVDRALRDLVHSATKSLKRGIREDSNTDDTPRSKASIEDKPAPTIPGNGSTLPGTCRNTTCHSFLRESWNFCPRCGTSVMRPGD